MESITSILEKEKPPESALEHDLFAEYCRVAKSVDFAPPVVLTQLFLKFCGENGVDFFPYAKVHGYLDQVFGEEIVVFPCGHLTTYRPTWGWRPLRKVDTIFPVGNRYGNFSGCKGDNDGTKNGLVLTGHYQKPVPFPVLLRAEEICSAFPRGVTFFVSDALNEEEVAIRDPFLAVSLDGQTFYVIERWDEPAFRS